MKQSEEPLIRLDELTKILDEVSRYVIGKRGILENLLVALLAGGHVLLEGVPGVAKTHIAKTFAHALGCEFTRIQFTPDLLPVDILGGFIFDQKTSDFKIRKGPMFSNVVLIDEINRGMPKTQSATIEVMQEGQVTIEGHTFPMPQPFMVIATKNPIEVHGVYPLSEAQIDRFMFSLRIDYPTAEEEADLIKRLSTIETPVSSDAVFQAPLMVMSAKRFLDLADDVERVYVSEDMKKYMVDLVRKTRELDEVSLGGSPRALIHLYKASKAKALVQGRDYVIPDDVKELIAPILNHRILLTRESEVEGLRATDTLHSMVDEEQIPGTRAVGTTK